MALQTLDRQEVDRFARTFEELFDRGDAAAMAAFYTEDAEVMAPDSEVVRGRDAIQAFADGQATTRFNDVTVWRLDAGRGWRIVVDSANREPARQ
jgi:ketosteroid isomerase-like protein